MKKKKEVIIIISTILFVITLFVKMNQTLQLILMLIAYILLGKDTVLVAIKNVEKGDFLDEKFWGYLCLYHIYIRFNFIY